MKVVSAQNFTFRFMDFIMLISGLLCMEIDVILGYKYVCIDLGYIFLGEKTRIVAVQN
jgi:hypothetical protein